MLSVTFYKRIAQHICYVALFSLRVEYFEIVNKAEHFLYPDCFHIARPE